MIYFTVKYDAFAPLWRNARETLLYLRDAKEKGHPVLAKLWSQAASTAFVMLAEYVTERLSRHDMKNFWVAPSDIRHWADSTQNLPPKLTFDQFIDLIDPDKKLRPISK